MYFSVLGDIDPQKHFVKLPVAIELVEKLEKINVFKLRLSWLALAPQAWCKSYSEAHFAPPKLTFWASLAHFVALSGSLSGTLWLTL